MQVAVTPSILNGTIKVPASKSMMQRVCAAALLHKGTCTISNIGTSNDDKAAVNIIEQLGAIVKDVSTSTIEITSDGRIIPQGNIDCGESGLSARLFTVVAALSSYEITITGSGSLLNRSMTPFEDLFQQLDVTIKDFSGKLPITIKGPLKPKTIQVDGSLSSQFLSGLLIAYSFTAKNKVSIKVTDLVSRPYIDMTLEVLQHFGCQVVNHNYEEFVVTPVATTENLTFDVEGDWSSASFWLVAAAINGVVELKGLNKNSAQADKAILKVLKDTGVDYIVEGGAVSVRSLSSRPNSFSFDATHAPDLFPILAIYAALCNGESAIKGLRRLSQKESDRVVSITAMLERFGVSFSIKEDVLHIKGQQVLSAATIDSYNDHRIAMAATIGALNADGACVITGAEAVNKSYTDFYKNLIALGGNCTIEMEAGK
ncbi:MAG: 3-phosphoshikimate 1-carboxyvinyltransferase [Flavipsychrobacter sp.]